MAKGKLNGIRKGETSKEEKRSLLEKEEEGKRVEPQINRQKLRKKVGNGGGRGRWGRDMHLSPIHQ